MELGERELHKIGEYVKTHLPQWMGESGIVCAVEGGESLSTLHKRELDLLERIVRVEDELKNLREVMEERFEAQQKQIDERFDHVEERFKAQQIQIDTRFEAHQTQMDRRFSTLQWTMNAGFLILAALIGAPLFL